jgi:hypothetical protein
MEMNEIDSTRIESSPIFWILNAANAACVFVAYTAAFFEYYIYRDSLVKVKGSWIGFAFLLRFMGE